MGAATGYQVMATEVSWEPIGGTVATAKGLDNPAVTSWKTKKQTKRKNLQPFCMGKYPKLSLFCCAGAKNPELELGSGFLERPNGNPGLNPKCHRGGHV